MGKVSLQMKSNLSEEHRPGEKSWAVRPALDSSLHPATVLCTFPDLTLQPTWPAERQTRERVVSASTATGSSYLGHFIHASYIDSSYFLLFEMGWSSKHHTTRTIIVPLSNQAHQGSVSVERLRKKEGSHPAFFGRKRARFLRWTIDTFLGSKCFVITLYEIFFNYQICLPFVSNF